MYNSLLYKVEKLEHLSLQRKMHMKRGLMYKGIICCLLMIPNKIIFMMRKKLMLEMSDDDDRKHKIKDDMNHFFFFFFNLMWRIKKEALEGINGFG